MRWKRAEMPKGANPMAWVLAALLPCTQVGCQKVIPAQSVPNRRQALSIHTRNGQMQWAVFLTFLTFFPFFRARSFFPFEGRRLTHGTQNTIWTSSQWT